MCVLQSMYNKDLTTMEPLEGPVQFAHQFVDMPNYNVQVTNNNKKKISIIRRLLIKTTQPFLGGRS